MSTPNAVTRRGSRLPTLLTAGLAAVSGTVLCLGSCKLATAPLPPGAVEFDAPAAYQLWWNLTEQCSGLSGDLSSISWYVVPGTDEIATPTNESVDGYWEATPKRIVLAGGSQYFGDLVRHEMLHALLGDTHGHPRTMFVQRCGGVVVCADRCLRDAGPAPAPDPDAISITPADLRIHATVSPPAPDGSQFNGTFLFIVSATNDRDQPVAVTLPPSGDAGPPVSFSYRVDSIGGGQFYDMRADAREVTRFAPRETKQFIFDFRNWAGDTRYDLAAGTYTFAGAYGGSSASPLQNVRVFP